MKLADGFGDDAGQCSPPASVDGSDGTLLGVDQENRDAVGGLNGEQKTGAVGDGSVALAGFTSRPIEKMDDVGMDLFKGDQRETRCAEGG